MIIHRGLFKLPRYLGKTYLTTEISQTKGAGAKAADFIVFSRFVIVSHGH